MVVEQENLRYIANLAVGIKGMPNISLRNNKPSVGATGVVVVDASVDDMVVCVGAVVEASETRTNRTIKVREI